MSAPLTRRLTPGYALPHDLEKLKTHLKAEDATPAESAYISDLAVTAGALWEAATGQPVMVAEYVTGFSGWHYSGRLHLLAPVQEVTKVQYFGEGDAYADLEPELYALSDLYPGLLVGPTSYSGLQPQLSYRTRINEGVLVYYTAGATSVDEVPPIVQQFIRLVVGHWYENRQEVVLGASQNGMVQIPMGAQALIDMEREPVL
ncbi:hypothetical protein LJY25_14750 [Hymenobacter sp. BT175]|uniref:head-tail connector protein n=1 Tax=Hymenobacter translucens TaxID=2886507 RepID=UPI001D0E8588|nr:hypothetical protein [Hymenobacter translucens]MCC2547712.1 hypothetical protein [Hymenobacter translucens]